MLISFSHQNNLPKLQTDPINKTEIDRSFGMPKNAQKQKFSALVSLGGLLGLTWVRIFRIHQAPPPPPHTHTHFCYKGLTLHQPVRFVSQ